MDRAGQESGAGGGSVVQQTNKWEEIFTPLGEGGNHYIMETCQPLPKFGRSYTNLNYPDTQGYMRMCTALSIMKTIVEAFDAMICEQQTCKKTRRGTVFGADKEDKAPKELLIYGG